MNFMVASGLATSYWTALPAGCGAFVQAQSFPGLAIWKPSSGTRSRLSRNADAGRATAGLGRGRERHQDESRLQLLHPRGVPPVEEHAEQDRQQRLAQELPHLEAHVGPSRHHDRQDAEADEQRDQDEPDAPGAHDRPARGQVDDGRDHPRHHHDHEQCDHRRPP
jgi:hypothetical protein